MGSKSNLSDADIETIGKFVEEGFPGQMNDVKEQLENIKENDVILFMKGDPTHLCGFLSQVVDILKEHKVESVTWIS